jgi:hypothetical protein
MKGTDNDGRHENVIAILDIIAPPSYEEFNEVYLVQVGFDYICVDRGALTFYRN